MLQTEHEFRLPKGFIDEHGTLHRDGVMRLATAADEILPQKDPRVQKNPAYLVVILLSRVIVRLGTHESPGTHTIEKLFAGDLDYLQSLYNELNYGTDAAAETVCPACSHTFHQEDHSPGKSTAIPSIN
jgi:hypothetical protein